MIRCPSCGKRLRDAAPSCVTHGPPPPAPPATEDAPTPFVVPTPELPAFLESFHAVDFRKPDPDPMNQLIWGITGHHHGSGPSADLV